MVIQKEHLENLKQEAKRIWPIDACALIGLLKADLSLVQEIHIVKNIDVSPVTFRIDPVVLYQAHTEAEAKGKEIVGILHSHPAPSVPSSIDRQYMKANPVTWLIMSTAGSFRAYQWRNEAIVEVKVEIINHYGSHDKSRMDVHRGSRQMAKS